MWTCHPRGFTGVPYPFPVRGWFQRSLHTWKNCLQVCKRNQRRKPLKNFTLLRQECGQKIQLLCLPLPYLKLEIYSLQIHPYSGMWAIFCLSMRRWYERCLPFSQMNNFENSRLKVNGEVVYENSNRKIETSRKKGGAYMNFFPVLPCARFFFFLLFQCRKICFGPPPRPLKKLKGPSQMNASHQPRLLKGTCRLAKLVINVYFKWYENNKQQISEIWSPDESPERHSLDTS